MTIELVDLKQQYQSLKDQIIPQIEQVLSGMKLFLGENGYQLEEEFAQYCGSRFGIGVGSGTDALYLALLATGVGPGDEVITVSHTFIATVEAIVGTGARPVFIDIDPATFNMDASQLEAAVTPRTRAVIPVHIYGHPADMSPVLAVARKHRLLVVEDACQAHGGEYRDARVGSMGDAAAFSFYYSKNLGAYGEGGMVVTKDRDIATRVQLLRNHGAKDRYHHSIQGINSRLDEVQAAILRIKLPHLDSWNTMRRTCARHYDQQLAEIDQVVTPQEQPYAKHVYHLYVIRVRDRDGLQRWLKSHGVATGVHYPVPSHLQEACSAYGYLAGSLPVTEAFADQVLSLPMYPELTVDQISYVCQTIRDYFKRSRRMRPVPASSAVQRIPS
ncbi:MAG: DegT/DnrJ/EryC1/StrS family aminotransferase [Dehalococcoidia bacterium]|nr:DegT/DnrJ/EryC1/StrS family aminotransferase [Dehalococcoidia bacterium]